MSGISVSKLLKSDNYSSTYSQQYEWVFFLKHGVYIHNQITLYDPVIVTCWFHSEVTVYLVSQLLSWLMLLSKKQLRITQNVTNESNVTCHILNTQIRELPRSVRVITARNPDPVPGKIPYLSRL